MLYKSGDSLLTQFPELQIVINPYTRFYLYRRYPKEVVPDIDRSDNMKEIYKFLKWYDENVDHDYLEPDTFFASAHNMLRNLFKAFDNNFYVNNFKEYCIDRHIDYDKMSDTDAKEYRIEWMIEPTTISQYIEIISHEEIQRYINLTHTLGNFLIVPKHFGKTKAFKFHESFVQSLEYLEDNFNDYKNAYHVDNFEQWKVKFLIEDFYENDELFDKISTAEKGLIREKNYKLFIQNLPLISNLIEKRTKKIIKNLNESKGVVFNG